MSSIRFQSISTQSTLYYLAIPLLLCITSCAKIFYSPDAFSLSKNHKIIAIVPPSVSISAKKKIDAEALKEQQKTESLNIQKELYAWILKRKMQGNFSQEVLDIETTNAKLNNIGYPNRVLTPGEMADALGVDAVLSSNFALSKPMSQGSAVALNLLFGTYNTTNEVRVSVDIHDRSKKKLIWNYTHTYSGGMWSTSASLINELMRHISKKMPYTIR